MSPKHDDVKRLLEFSVEDNAESAIALFSMFSPQQIQSLYSISIIERMQILRTWETDDRATAHFVRRFHDPHDPGQAAKMREIGTDPSNK